MRSKTQSRKIPRQDKLPGRARASERAKAKEKEKAREKGRPQRTLNSEPKFSASIVGGLDTMKISVGRRQGWKGK